MGTARNIMLTGTGSGIGRALAERLVGAGHTVVGGVISSEEGDAIAHALGPRFHPVVIDVRSESSAQQAALQVSALLNQEPLSGLANIAGVITNGPLMDLDAQTFQNVLAVNVVGVHNVTRAFLPLLRQAGRATVVNMSSASGSRTMPFTGAYSASKFAVEALSTAMRLEFAPVGIAVSVVAPGMIHTPMAEQIHSDLRKPSSDPVYAVPLQHFLGGAVKASRHSIPMERVVSVFEAALTSGRPAIRYALHNNFLQDVVLLRMLPIRVRDAIIRRVLGLNPSPN